MTIDVHTHVVPMDFPAYAGRRPATAWPSTCAAPCGHRHVMIDGKVFRTVPGASWDVDARLADMDAMGIERQALSPMPELLSYWFSEGDALSMCRVVNDAIGAMVDASRGRFVGLGMLPMQSPELAARELGTLMRDGRFKGFELGTNIGGVSIGDARFEPVFAEAERLGVAVLVHALHPVGDERLIGPPVLRAFVSFPCETAFAIAALMTGGVLSRYPRLKIAFSHGGGAFAAILPRLQHGWQTMDALAKLVPESPREIARRLYYDTLVYDPAMLGFLLTAFGEHSLMIGTDYPFEIYDRDPLGSLDAAGFDPDILTLARSGNARRFLSL